MEIIASIIFIAIVYIISKAPEWKAHNRLCPLGKRLDVEQMNYDRTVNHMSNRDICIKQNRGGYDIPIGKKK